MRVFVAVEVSQGARDELDRLSRQLRHAKSDAAWTAPENYHLTLKFFGSLDAAQVARVKKMLAGVAAGSKSFRLQLGGVGAFPSLNRPSVLWVGLSKGEEDLSELARRMLDALAGDDV